MTNFDFLLSDPQFTTFGEVAVAAEKIYTIDPAGLCAELPPVHGVCRQMDVLCGRRFGHALRRLSGQPHGHRGFPGHRGSGPVAAP